MTEPWNLTEPQRRQLREAHAEAKRARAQRTPRPKRITEAKAARLVAAMEALRECEDCPTDLSIAMDDARAAISPWYDR
jgi:hypothetical protein